MLIDSDVRFKVKNFTSEEVGKIQQQWSEIKILYQGDFYSYQAIRHQSTVFDI